MATIIQMKGTREAPKSFRSKMETIIFGPKEIEGWKLPPFQRPLRINEKVRALAAEMQANQTVNGVLTLGKYNGETFVVDGQHRLEAFKISGLGEIIADVRVCEFDSMAEMADEFVCLNSSLVRMRPDDVLRGMEQSVPALMKIRKDCPFVGYDQIRRSESSPVVGMSGVLRCWQGSAGDTPSQNQMSGAQIAQALDAQATEHLIQFLATAYAAWGRDPEYYRLWAALNVTMCMWLWRRLVLDRERGVKRYVVLNIAQFKKCLMSLSADGNYCDWLQSRHMSDRDRSPCYTKIKSIFVRRLIEDGMGDKTRPPKFPTPAWAA
jgi:hypothetical protein